MPIQIEMEMIFCMNSAQMIVLINNLIQYNHQQDNTEDYKEKDNENFEDNFDELIRGYQDFSSICNCINSM